ncbi:hypothetical protein F4678DRAFT_203264 [Xylaria arbuscula]|nr:hypothetical protein F4678DRAFT_203264 [Xylaria arbuscula]
MAVVISESVAGCLQEFQATSLKSYELNDAARQKLRDEFARFKLWAGNIGAHRKGRSSLDWRLRDASHLRDLVVNLLTDLKNTLDDVSSIINGSFDTHLGSPDHASTDHTLNSGDFDEIDNEAEILETMADIADIIGCLMRLSVSIRNPAPHDHFMSSRFINMSHFEEYDMEHVKAKLPLAQPALARRLGKAISQRRQYFKYREAHHQKLNAGLDLDPTKSEAGAQSTIASSVPNALKNGDKSHPAFGELEEEASNSGASQTSYATSGPESGRLKMPSLPKEASDGPFECPFCYMMISASTTIQWKKHVNADLRPYICLELDCLTSEQQYARRHEWLNHLSQKHWRIFECPYSCQGADFDSRGRLERHLRHSHSGLSAQGDLGMIFHLCERPKPWPEEVECPLCKQALYSRREYARHVGRHQTELALFALPGIRGDDGDEDDSDDVTQHFNNGEFPAEDDSDSEKSELSDDLEPENDLEIQSALTDDPGQPSAANEDEQDFRCATCGQTFDALHKLVHHSRYHDRTHECTFEGCDKKFGTKTHLDRHINDRHLKRKAYHCTESSCAWFKGGKSFPRKDNWRRHMVKKHGATPQDLDNMEL